MKQQLYDLVIQNDHVRQTLDFIADYSREELWIGAGALVQTVWNLRFGLPASHGIDDIDIVYCNTQDLSEAAENRVIRDVQRALKQIPLRLDVKNQARVHLWYRAHFGFDIPPIKSIAQAIALWPTTATAIVTRQDAAGQVHVQTGFGYDDLFSGVVRPNKAQISAEIYRAKTVKWLQKWPGLTVIPWD